MDIQNIDITLNIKVGDASLIIAALQKVDPTGIFTIALQQKIDRQVKLNVKNSQPKAGDEVLIQEKV
uniref:Uncharacterized protein n=1 Tax=viral metagenome TaxID=1070528 RepID=A0A6H1ZY82_9ZZZZ